MNNRIKQIGRIKAIISFLLSPNNQIQNALKMLRLVNYNDLGIHSSNIRKHYGKNKELWMLEEDYQIILVDNIIKPVSVWLKDLPELMSYNFCVSEILYRDVSTNRMQIQPVNLRHRHPSEHII